MPAFRLSTILVWSSIVIAALSSIISALGLIDAQVYAKETENWTMQAKGQDIGNLLTAVVLILASLRAHAGSKRAFQVWVGGLLYFIYAYLIYSMAVHLNYLFLGYVTVLGLCAYTLIGALYGNGKQEWYEAPEETERKFPAILLMVIGGLFSLLWLGELIPALVSGTRPQSLVEAGLIVNPIHAVDLSLVLPGMILAGYLLKKGHSMGLFWAGPWLAFSAFMGASIVAALAIIFASGDSKTVPAMVMVGIIVILSVVGLRYRLSGIR